MALNTVIDVAIGLSLMYLLLSLFATIVNEKISAIFALRSRTLKSGVQQILSGTSFADVTQHALIGVSADDKNWPSYISGQSFAMAVLDRLNPDSQMTDTDTYKAVVGAIDKLPDDDARLKEMLRGVVNNSAASLTQVRDSLAAWFDNSMMRLEGDFKRLMRWVSLGVGLLIAVSFNADSFHVATVLWRDPAIRAAVADQATTVTPILADKDGKGGLTAQEVQQQLTQLPIGWHAGDVGRVFNPWNAGFQWADSLLIMLGWLVTAMAIALGAPFWFDLLGQFINIRSSGGKPPVTQMPAPASQPTASQPTTVTAAQPALVGAH